MTKSRADAPRTTTRKTPNQRATEVAIFYSAVLGSPHNNMPAVSINNSSKTMKRHFAFLRRVQKQRRQTTRNTPFIGSSPTSNSYHFPFVRKVRRFFNSRSRYPFPHRRHLAFSRKAALPNPCICAFAKSNYALRASFDARSAPNRLSNLRQPRVAPSVTRGYSLSASTIPHLPTRQKAR